MLEFKGIKTLGGLYLDGNPVERPSRPWSKYVDLEGKGAGNVVSFSTAPSMERWNIGNTPAEDVKQLNWVHFEENGKQLLVCDRNILCEVSWDTLNEFGFVEGRIVEIDGTKYVCKLLSGGVMYRNGDKDGGVPERNDWDRLVLNEGGIAGLPSLSDLDENEDAAYNEQQATQHNALWNWLGMVSWCRDTYSKRSSCRVLRGYLSARYWGYFSSSCVGPLSGWRPVLESL